MDFNYRAVYNSSQPPQTPPYPPSSVFNEQSPGGAGGSPMMSTRKREKKRICQEIVAEEMVRARRRKLAVEREMGIPIHMGLEPPPRFVFQERVLNSVAIDNMPQSRIMDSAEIKQNTNQNQLERVNLRWNPKSSLVAIEDIPQPCIMNPTEIKPTNDSDQVIPLERVNQQLHPKSNQVAIEDIPQPGIMDPAEIKPASLQDERIMRERVHLRLNPKLNLVAIEDMPQPCFMDPAEINQDEVIPPAKPDTDLYDAKKKAEAPAVSDSQICLIKKPEEEWGCMPCGVTASDENSLNVHLNVKKHKANEASLGAEKIVKSTFSSLSSMKNLKLTDTIITTTSGLNAKADIKTHQALGGEDTTQKNNQDDVIMLAKPDTGLYDAKRKAEAPAVNDSQFGLIKKPKNEFGCTLCGVTATDAGSLNAHLGGKKHKAKEAALGAEKIVNSTFSLLSSTKNLKSNETIITTTSGLNAKADIKTHQTFGGEDMTLQNVDSSAAEANKEEQVVQKSQNIGVSEINEVTTVEAGKTNAFVGRNMQFWGCKLCGVSATDASSLKAHLCGKKHKAKEAALEAEKIVNSTFSLLSSTKNLKSNITTTSGLNAKADIKTHQALGWEDMTLQNVDSSAAEANKEEQVVQKSQNIGVSEINEVTTVEAGKTNAFVGRNMQFWGCKLCGVSATDASSLKAHLCGKKHKAKEAALEAEKIVNSTFSLLSSTKNLKSNITTTSGLNAKADIKTHQALGWEGMTLPNVDSSAAEANKEEQVVQKSQNIGVSEINEVTTVEAGKTNAFVERNMQFLGCKLYGVSAKAKEAALEAEKIVNSTFSLLSSTKNLKSNITTTSGLNAKADIKTHQALGWEGMTLPNVDSSAAEANKEEQVVQKSQNIGVSEINEVTTVEAGKTNAFVERNMQFLGCKLCGVSATDASSLNAHLCGKKHKAKEAALRAEKTVKSISSSLSAMKNVKSTETIFNTTSGLDAKAWGGEDETQQNVDLSAVDANKEEQVVQESQNIVVSEINEVTTEEAGKTNALVGSKRELRCDICGLDTTSQIQMEEHKRGSKHRRRMERTSLCR